MAILITAPLGTGKTLKTMELIFSYLNEGREVFTNIIGLKITGARIVESTPYYPFDWRDLPDGAVLIWDEAHEHPAFSERDLLKNYKIESYEQRLIEAENSDLTDTKKKALIAQIDREYAKALRQRKEQIMDIGYTMSMHRQFGMELILITQNPTKLNKDVLANVTIHHVMRRKFGFDAANIWTFGEAMTTWGKSVADSALVKEYWRFPKHLYKFYISAEQHNVKKYFPKKYYAYACVPLLIFYLGYHKASETGFFGLVPKSEASTQTTSKADSVDPTEMGYDAELIQLDPNGPERLELDKLQAQSLGLTVEQYRAMKQPSAIQDINTECRQAINTQRPECVEWLNNLGQQIQTASYDPNDPYAFQPPVQVQINDYPRLSGCAKFGDKYYAFDQQGNKMPNIKQDACKRWMAGEKPFNYSGNTNTQPQQVMNNAPIYSQADNPQPDQSVIQKTQQIEYANNQIQPHLESKPNLYGAL